ncbi:MAG TPA: dihydroorotate dehydrogenase-like protein [bacterium]|jgi:dihydroorotate dehydrogenase (fumarate)
MDLSTTYLGFNLPHPLMAAAGPMSDSLDAARRLEDAGAAAIVLRSLFEEQIASEGLATHRALDSHTDTFAEALTYLPDPEDFVLGPQEYLEHLRMVKEVVGVPVIASLNGTSAGGWLDYGRQMAEAGADALELNLYDVPMDAERSAAVIEDQAAAVVIGVKDLVALPVAVKLSPFYTSPAHFARRLVAAGADGLVLFNRYFEPDIDVEALEIMPCLHLSNPAELLLRLRWLAILSARVETSFAVTGGVHTGVDAVKAVMCGADAVQLLSLLLLRGPEALGHVRDEMARWLEEHEYDSLAQARGSMNLDHCPAPHRLGRANYMYTLQTWEPA